MRVGCSYCEKERPLERLLIVAGKGRGGREGTSEGLREKKYNFIIPPPRKNL